MDDDWEERWAPYDEDVYHFVLDAALPGDVVVDIGAGDLRLALRMAPLVQQIYAIERNRTLTQRATRQCATFDNLVIVCADALTWTFPQGVTLAVLLMRHCTREHFATYVRRLRDAGCRRLITNARWKMGVEIVDLQNERLYDPRLIGWYACHCGAVGFSAPDTDQITLDTLNNIINVIACPHCSA